MGNAPVGIGAVVLVTPIAIPLFGNGLKYLLKALREPSEEEHEKYVNIVALTWGPLIMGFAGCGPTAVEGLPVCG
ncbi:MAG: hypothetical protein GX033_07980 [Firmicutes bacterium]|nr:hypothetical protein [Bacillota bacterium]